MNHDHFLVPPGKTIRLKDYDPEFTSHYDNKHEASAKLRKDIKRLTKYQDVRYAQHEYSLLVILQAMDTAGKDGTIRHVMSGVNPHVPRRNRALVSVTDSPIAPTTTLAQPVEGTQRTYSGPNESVIQP